jgi:predicted phosphodiesterase
MKKILQQILKPPVLWLVQRFSSKPNKSRIFASLTRLYKAAIDPANDRALLLEAGEQDKFIIFSDQHKGNKGKSDDFNKAAPNYMAALEYYYQQGYHLISLGDEEELWKYTIWQVSTAHKDSIALQKKFFKEKRFTKVFGNHDIFWHNEPFAQLYQWDMYGQFFKIYEGILLSVKLKDKTIPILLTHGHQGDGQSDGNWFSAWFVSKIWAPLQSWLELNPNTPAVKNELKTEHNQMMYQWSITNNYPALITGHTHQPVFASLTHIERLYKQLNKVKATNNTDAINKLLKEIDFRQKEYDYVVENYQELIPAYFNTGCCCFNDGDITGIEIAEGQIRLIKWDNKNGYAKRQMLEQMPLLDVH